jgi:hypothetical protein
MNALQPIPAPGYTLISGKRKPPADWGEALYCQLRSGICGREPWPVATVNWIHQGTTGDIVAVRKAD